MNIPIKKIMYQVVLFIILSVLALNVLFTKILVLNWFNYAALGMAVVLFVVIFLISKTNINGTYFLSNKQIKTQNILLYIFLFIYILHMVLGNFVNKATDSNNFFVKHNTTLLWIVFVILMLTSILGIVLKMFEYKKAITQ